MLVGIERDLAQLDIVITVVVSPLGRMNRCSKGCILYLLDVAMNTVCMLWPGTFDDVAWGSRYCCP